ncbi:MAG: rod shape-determining protein, partial [Oscillospiraceae bacterium]|nr:rod shape-determining protein [Oscillospiraceae bacterium]
MAQNDVGIDLGTTSIIIYVEGKGIVLNEPTIVAVDTRAKEVLAVGNDAYKMVGRTPAHINAVFPLKEGVISDHTLTKELIRRFLLKVYDSRLIKPKVSVCVPAAITGIESDAVVEAV